MSSYYWLGIYLYFFFGAARDSDDRLVSSVLPQGGIQILWLLFF